jgi:folate-binding protein YgfZ
MGEVGITPIPAPESDLDFGVAWHYGDPHREQRLLIAGEASVDLSHWGVVTVTGVDRLSWLHSLTTAFLDNLEPYVSRIALILSPHGHVEQELHVVDDGETTWLITPPNTANALTAYLNSMRFMLRVEVADRSDEFAVVWEPVHAVDHSVITWLTPDEFSGAGIAGVGYVDKYVAARPELFLGRQVIVPRSMLAERLDQFPYRAGTWAYNAIRTAAAVPQLARETDHKSLPHELGWIGSGVHLQKGCYRGQETVARVYNLGKPPRRLVLLHLDGSDSDLPSHGDEVTTAAGKVIGFIATPARHYELGPIATAVIKRSTPVDETLHVIHDGNVITANQELVVTDI